MNRNLRLFLSLVVLCFLAVPAFAQDEKASHKGSADIPFDFYISGNMLPAGHYTFDLIAPTYVLLRNEDGKVQQPLYFMQTAVAGKNTPSQVVFAVREGKYYLAEVWGWFGKAQLTSFTSKPGEQTKTVPLHTGEKTVAKP